MRNFDRCERCGAYVVRGCEAKHAETCEPVPQPPACSPEAVTRVERERRIWRALLLERRQRYRQNREGSAFL